ncbi:P1 family peptidase [Acidaminobacter sp. JC074]|uniref:DmpA family aminopeptidase n=1 Tax=Acidaminobacter sp. JC074 TaxID=2530199 RepID=UPI001F0F0AC1|nr:P1 family peptidase [Acidaminobacter sp. JC074]MCH4891099.1 P1 family peptidase [Acidaminobacter sp. JC074]
MKKGRRNAITDVEGVYVGHATHVDGDVQTGVTAILPRRFNWFREKTRAACHVINGFGKSIGLIQVDELYTLETPILLTNTLSAGHVSDCLIKFMLSHFDEIGLKGTVNPVVCECNDGYLNNIRKQSITEHDVLSALNNAGEDFERGAVGAGRGMSCYHLKGGIGTASRIIEIEDLRFTVGGLVLTNMGKLEDLIYDGKKIGPELKDKLTLDETPDKGSIIMILATDLPLESHQLKRMSKRAGAGLARTGTYISHGSGDIVIAFTTDSPVTSKAYDVTVNREILHDDYMDLVFKAAVEVIEESIYDSLLSADEVTGFSGHNRKALKNLL